MLATIWVMVQLLLFALAQFAGSYPQVDIPAAVLLAVVGIFAVSAFTPVALRVIVRVLGLVPQPRSRPARAWAAQLPAPPCAPGSRGTVRVRAPSGSPA